MLDMDLNLHPLPHFNCTLTFALQWLAGNYLEKWEIYSGVLTLMLTLTLTLTATLDSNMDWMKRKKLKNIIMLDRDLNLHPLPHFNCTLTFALQWPTGNHYENWKIYSGMLTLMLTLTLTLTATLDSNMDWMKRKKA